MRVFPMSAKFGSALARVRGCALHGLLAGAMVAPLIAVPVFAQNDNPLVARVEGTEIRASDLAAAEEDIGSNLGMMPAEQKREYLVTFLTDMTLIAKAAEQKQIADTDEFKRRLAYMRNKLLMEIYLEKESKSAATEAALRTVYEEASKAASAEKEVRARHILVENENEAKDILAQLKKGADFAALAKEKSKDPGSAEGGDLGYFTKDQMVPEFADVAFKLEKGQLSDPVKTQFGWHVIKLEDKRDRQVPPFEQVKDQLEQFVTRRAQAETITKLREGAKIERLDPKPAEAKPAAPAEQKK